MKRWITAGVAVAALSVVGCGGDSAVEPTAAAKAKESGPQSGCRPVPVTLRRALADSLKGNRTLGQLYAVQSEGSFSGPRGLAQDAWFVTGDVRPGPGLSTWIVSDEAFRTGGGIIIGVSPSARAVSDAGDLVSLDAIDVNESSDGYEESVACFG
jgi:hypothetical protein